SMINVYVFRGGNHQAMFVVTSAGVIATDPIGYGRPQMVNTYVDEIKKVTSQEPSPRHRRCGMLTAMPGPRRPLRALHTADVHLDSDSYGDARERAAHRAREHAMFRRIVDLALADRVDVLLIAGDL